MNKPVDLIVANTLHEAASMREQLPEVLKSALDNNLENGDGIDQVSRALLSNMAASGTIHQVRLALAAIGAPSERDEIRRQFRAVCEQRAEARGETTREDQTTPSVGGSLQ